MCALEFNEVKDRKLADEFGQKLLKKGVLVHFFYVM